MRKIVLGIFCLLLFPVSSPASGQESPRVLVSNSSENEKKATESQLTNSIGMKFARILPGKFLMGSPPKEKGRGRDEGPQHEVEITKPFYIGIYEVTQAQYEKILGVCRTFRVRM